VWGGKGRISLWYFRMGGGCFGSGAGGCLDIGQAPCKKKTHEHPTGVKEKRSKKPDTVCRKKKVAHGRNSDIQQTCKWGGLGKEKKKTTPIGQISRQKGDSKTPKAGERENNY